MIKFIAPIAKGNLYGFGLTENELNRMEFNNETIFFDFGYADQPKLFGLILYLESFQKPEDILNNFDALTVQCLPFFNSERGVTSETLRVFPMAKNIMQEFRNTPFWGYSTQIEITNPNDQQLIFAGKDEQAIEEYLQRAGLLTTKTKRTYKGFGGNR
jgi:hypothetical protein